MDEIWRRIEAWLAANAAPVGASLAPPALHTTVEAVGGILGVTMPADAAASYLIHDGQVLDDYGCSPGFIYGRNLYPLEKAINRWRARNELLASGRVQIPACVAEGPVRAAWWHKSWFPIADDGNSNYYCLDFVPVTGGVVGQVISVWNESPRRVVVASSFGAWLAAFAAELEDGEYLYSEDHNGLITVADAEADGLM
jgi:cell wall assembly regulator SMI1